jgi:hypothetical protein
MNIRETIVRCQLPKESSTQSAANSFDPGREAKTPQYSCKSGSFSGGSGWRAAILRSTTSTIRLRRIPYHSFRNYVIEVRHVGHG